MQGFDASSDEYYNTIEAAVASRFPEKWAAWQAHLEALAAAAAAAAAEQEHRQGAHFH